MAARAWIRERALETDSHHECIGSEEEVLLGSALLGVGVDEDGDDDESLRWNSICSFFFIFHTHTPLLLLLFSLATIYLYIDLTRVINFK